MADHKDDEYQFEDANLMSGEAAVSSTEPLTETASQATPASTPSPTGFSQVLSKFTPTQRVIVVAVGVIFWLIVIYQGVAHFHHGTATKSVINPPVPQQQFAPMQPVVQPPSESATSADSGRLTAIEAKLSAFSSSESDLQNTVADTRTEVSTLRSSMQTLTDQIQSLTAQVQRLSEKVDVQSQTVQLLELKMIKPKPKPKRPKHHAYMVHYLQAIIPGRAWLISADGQQTQTVRVGSPVVGYGVIQMIDPNRGRVLTSSGKTIHFSRQDT